MPGQLTVAGLVHLHRLVILALQRQVPDQLVKARVEVLLAGLEEADEVGPGLEAENELAANEDL